MRGNLNVAWQMHKMLKVQQLHRCNRQGGDMEYKNSEGYQDKTAGAAVANTETSEIEKKKAYLYSYKDIGKQIRRLNLEIVELRSNRMSTSSKQDGMPHGSSTKDLSDYASKLDEIERNIRRERYRRIIRFEEIRAKIEQMNDEDEKDILFLRYIRTMRWEDVCEEKGMSWKQVHRVHKRALDNFEL